MGSSNSSSNSGNRSGKSSRSIGSSGSTSSKISADTPKKTQKKRPAGKRARNKQINRYIRIAGRAAFLLQMLVSLFVIIRVAVTGLLPGKYLVLTTLLIVALGVLTYLMNLRRNRVIRCIGLAISVIVIIGLLMFNNYLSKTLNLLSAGENSYKTDDMVVAVRADDPAESIKDAADYTFGAHLVKGETGGSTAMVEDIQSRLEKNIDVKEYASASQAAEALLEGKVDAAIYNQAYTSVLSDLFEDYEDKVKIIDHYGIQTEYEKESVDAGEPFNVLISGIDVYGDISQTSRSDVNIIVTVNPKTKKILLTSTPRDYYVTIPGVSGDQRDKLTHAGIYGVDASMRTLENLYGIDITYFVRVNFDTLIKLVDAVGGLDIYVEYPFETYTDDYYFEQGWHDMYGDQVLAFCRERYSFADGDNQRGRNQEMVLKLLLDKLMSPAVLANLDEVFDALDGCFQTNMPEKKITELVNMQLSDNASWDVLRQTASQGESELAPTYSGGSTPLYIMWPDTASVFINTTRIDMILEEKPEK